VLLWVSIRGMNILLVDDHALFRSGLKFLLSDLDSRLSFSEAASLREVERFTAESFDLILLDWNLPGTLGDQVLSTVRVAFPESTIVVLSGEEDPALVKMAVDRGAAGFIPKASQPAVMVNALRLVLAGGIYLPAQMLFANIATSESFLSPKLAPVPNVSPASTVSPASIVSPASTSQASSSVSWLGSKFEGPLASLTDRQQLTLMLAVRGKSNKEIARELDASEGTVKLYLSTAFRLLGVSNRTEAVYAVANLAQQAAQTGNNISHNRNAA
jgi:DNA-binding NarL/FixJ family response regulator